MTTPFCLGFVTAAVLIAVAAAVSSWVALELMDGRGGTGFDAYA